MRRNKEQESRARRNNQTTCQAHLSVQQCVSVFVNQQCASTNQLVSENYHAQDE